ncbi:MAG: TetR/AcrR family transcriptional regulator [Acidimicrobiia bacterium]
MAVRLPAEQRRRQLLDVGLQVFAERGFHATSMDDVALAAGVTKPVLYQHFPNKRGMYLTLLEDVGYQLLTELGAATSQAKHPHDQVEAGFLAYFRYVHRNRAGFRLLFGASVRNDSEFAEVADQTVADAAAAISGLIEIDGPEAQRLALAHALIGVAESTARWALSRDEDFDPRQLALWVAQMVWYGLRGVSPVEVETSDDWRERLIGSL